MPYTPWPGSPPPVGEGGATVHSQLTGRSSANAHPISAITGLQDALDAGARVWAVATLLDGGTIDTLIGFLTWAAIPASGYAWDDDGLKFLDKDAETITLVTDHQPGDLAVITRTVDFNTFDTGEGGFQEFSAANTLDIAGPWLATQDDFVAVDASDWEGTLDGVLGDSVTLAQVLDALGALDLDGPDLSGYALSNDSRFSDARYPTSHADSHREGGSDVLHAPRFRVFEAAATNVDSGDDEVIVVELAPLYAICRVQAVERDCRFRIYMDNTRQNADMARPFGDPFPADSGCLLDVELSSSEKLDLTPALLGFTAGPTYDSAPNGADVYVTYTNTDGSNLVDAVPFLFVWVDLHDGLDGTPVGDGNPTS